MASLSESANEWAATNHPGQIILKAKPIGLEKMRFAAEVLVSRGWPSANLKNNQSFKSGSGRR